MGFCERFVSVKGAGEEGFLIRSDDETTVTLSISCSYKHPHCQTAWLSLPAVLSPPDRKERTIDIRRVVFLFLSGINVALPSAWWFARKEEKRSAEF